MSTLSVSVTSNFSLSMGARGLKFCIQALHIDAEKVTLRIFEILSRGLDIVVYFETWCRTVLRCATSCEHFSCLRCQAPWHGLCMVSR